MIEQQEIDMKKIIFVIPTLFHNKELVVNCVQSLRTNMSKFDIQYEIFVVINTMTDEFQAYDFGDHVNKLSSDLQFNIGKALNTVALNVDDYDYFCYVDEGLTIDNDIWINYLIELFDNNDNIGIVGCRPHSTFNNFNKKITTPDNYLELYEVLWSDGIMFTTKEIMYKFNGYDESYFGDCEMQDFGYRVHFSGYINIYWPGLFKHTLIDYRLKSNKPDELIALANQARQLFKNKWNDIEYKNYNFMSTPS